MKRTILRYIKIKLHKTKEKEEKIESSQRKMKHYIQTEKINHYTIYLSEHLEPRKQWENIIKVIIKMMKAKYQRNKNYQPGILYLAIMSL